MTCSHATRRPDRGRCRPRLEALEIRNLLSSTPTPTSPADALIGATLTRAIYGVDGSGYTVAEIDTGVNYNHRALGGGFGPGRKVVAGYDLADNSPDPDASWQHGTAVAGLIASEDSAHPGVAPGADLVALRVFDRSNNGSFGKIADALQWVVDHHQQYHITAVNISVTDGGNYSRDWFSGDGQLGQRIDGLVGQLKALDIPVVSAAGNSFDGNQGMGFTAILPDTISVTASDASDHLAGDAQRLGSAQGGAAATDLAAPGVGVVTTVQGNDFATVDGTSFAAPQVTGAVVLLQQIYAKRFGHLPSVDDLNVWLKQGADPIQDPTTGLTIGRLDIARSATLIPGGQPQSPPGNNPGPPAASDPPPASGSDAPGTPATPPDNPTPTDSGPAVGQPTPSKPPPQSGGSPGASDPGTPPSGGTPDSQPPSGSPGPSHPSGDPGTPSQGGPSGSGGDIRQGGGASGSTPATSPPSGGRPSGPTTSVTLDGQPAGSFDASDSSSPLHALFLALGGDVTIGSVQVWTGASSLGDAFTAGTIQGMFQPAAASQGTGPVVRVRGRAATRAHGTPRAMQRAWHAGFAKRHRSV